jgi:hypothetical protein
MALLQNYHQFVLRTGMLLSDEALDPYGIESCDRFGGFRRSRILELQMICKSNPALHVVSWLNVNVNINRFAPGARLFYLAIGDSDPRLLYDVTTKGQDSDVLEFRLGQSTS